VAWLPTATPCHTSYCSFSEEVNLVGTLVRQPLTQPFSCDIIGESINKANGCYVNVIDYNVEVGIHRLD
jgi:hypothetical protein